MARRPVITLQHVAARAGVSLMTASRALRGLASVAPGTRAVVEAAADDLGYVRNALAGTLASRTASDLVGAVVGTLSDTTYALTLDGMSEVLDGAGLQLVVGVSNFESARELAQARALVGRQVAGLLLTNGRHAAPFRRLVERTPTVEVWDVPRRPLDMAVGFSNEAAGRLAAEHLLRIGRRRLAFAGSGFYRDRARWRGFAAAAAAAGVGPPMHLELAQGSVGDDGFANGEQLAARLAAGAAERIDGLFVCDDTVAIAAIAAAQRAGLAIPERLAVVGLGNHRLSAHVNPRLTSVCVRAYEIGAVAGQMLLAPSVWRRTPTIDLGIRIEVRDTA